MSATLTWTCDICSKTAIRDVSDDAACDFSVRVRYPLGWYVGDEKAACTNTHCQVEVAQANPYLPERDGDTRDTL